MALVVLSCAAPAAAQRRATSADARAAPQCLRRFATRGAAETVTEPPTGPLGALSEPRTRLRCLPAHLGVSAAVAPIAGDLRDCFPATATASREVVLVTTSASGEVTDVSPRPGYRDGAVSVCLRERLVGTSGWPAAASTLRVTLRGH